MVVFLIVATLLSVAATTLVVFSDFGSSSKPVTTTTSKAQEQQQEQKIVSPTPTETLTPSPTPTPIKGISVIISPYITATSSSDKKSIFINFWQVADSKSALYKLDYKASGVVKGSSGNIVFASNDKQLSREIVLGVCSSGGSCTYDSNIKDIQIVVTFTQKDGATSQITYPYTL